MNKTTKDMYEAPSTKVVAVKTRGLICVSNNSMVWTLNGSALSSGAYELERDGYGDAFELPLP